MQSERFIIIGGAGFIGGNLTARLVRDGKSVVVYDIRSEMPGCPGGVVYVRGDLKDTDRLAHLMRQHRIDTVVHLAGTILPGSPLDDFYRDVEDNLVTSAGLIDAMLREDVRRLVFLSSGGTVYGNNGKTVNREDDLTFPINLYGWMKLAIENYIRMVAATKPVDYLILRPSNAYGVGQNLTRNQGLIGMVLLKIRRGEKIEIWGDGGVVRDYLYVDDLSDAVVKLAEQSRWNETFNVGSGSGVSVNEVLEAIRVTVPIKFEVVRKAPRSIDIPANVLDISKIAGALGWKPSVDLKTGIAKTWEWIESTTDQ